MDEALDARLAALESEHDEVIESLADPDVLADSNRYRDLSIRHGELRAVVEGYRAYKAAAAELADAEELRDGESDAEMRAYLAGEADDRRSELASLETELRLMLVPPDPDDDRDVIVEIRAAAGGEEAALWAADLLRMYQRFAERHRWTVEPIDSSLTDSGGIKESTFAVKGRGVFSRFKHEAGPHRVQRVPKTESQGRVHTSVATVAVLPEAEDVEVEINDADLRIETFRSTGPGGQSVNTTDSAVRIIHEPSGITVSCQDEKSQLQNKLKAMRVLRARLYHQQLTEQLGERASARREQVGSGERAEKIRTYNFKENRVTDHRVGLTRHALADILDGDLEAFHEALRAREAAAALADTIAGT